MRVVRLKANCFRNFNEVDLEFSPHFNFIYGQNGSGKSSLLEAIYFLGLGRSFRTVLASRAIQYESDRFHLFSLVLGQFSTTLGLEKTRQGKIRIKIKDSVGSVGELIKILPIQLINPHSYQLLNGGPKARRQFIDWGVFHVEPQFFSIWRQFQQVLKQRNSALQQRALAEEINIWNLELIRISNEITQLRERYIQKLIPLIMELLSDLLVLKGLKIDFYQGWSERFSLKEIFLRSFHQDCHLGYTQYGPQRADLLIKIYGNPVHEVLSRGEQKLLVCAFQLAQGLLLKRLTTRSCIYLLDDLFAELDLGRRNHLVRLLGSFGAQVFITLIENSLIKELKGNLEGKVLQTGNDQIIEKIIA